MERRKSEKRGGREGKKGREKRKRKEEGREGKMGMGGEGTGILLSFWKYLYFKVVLFMGFFNYVSY